MKQIFFLSLVLIFLNACNNVDKDETAMTEEKAGKEVNEKIDDIREYTDKEKEQIMNEFRVRRDRTTNRIIDLKKKLVEIQKDKKQDFEKTITDLETFQNDIEHRLSDLDAATDEAYEDIKIGVDSALTNINIAIDKARKNFEKPE